MFILNVDGVESFEIKGDCITSVEMSTDIPADSNARTKDMGSTIIIKGRILAAVNGGEADGTKAFAEWSAIPAESADCYRSVTVQRIAGGVLNRKYVFPNAFVIDYEEDFGDVEGTGTYTLLIKQKKDKISDIVVEGGYSAE